MYFLKYIDINTYVPISILGNTFVFEISLFFLFNYFLLIYKGGKSTHTKKSMEKSTFIWAIYAALSGKLGIIPSLPFSCHCSTLFAW